MMAFRSRVVKLDLSRVKDVGIRHDRGIICAVIPLLPNPIREWADSPHWLI